MGSGGLSDLYTLFAMLSYWKLILNISVYFNKNRKKVSLKLMVKQAVYEHLENTG